jgi:hypothetical protein
MQLHPIIKIKEIIPGAVRSQVAKGVSKITNKTFPLKEHKLKKWLRASGLCQLLWMPHTRKVVVLIGKKEMKDE